MVLVQRKKKNENKKESTKKLNPDSRWMIGTISTLLGPFPHAYNS